MAKMSAAEALKLSHRINKVLRPFEHATEILHAAYEAESGLGRQRKEAAQLESDMGDQRAHIGDLTRETQIATNRLSDLRSKTVAEKELLATRIGSDRNRLRPRHLVACIYPEGAS